MQYYFRLGTVMHHIKQQVKLNWTIYEKLNTISCHGRIPGKGPSINPSPLISDSSVHVPQHSILGHPNELIRPVDTTDAEKCIKSIS